MNYPIISLRETPTMLEDMAKWFHKCWGIPEEAYRESMEDCLAGASPIPQWYAALDGEKIVGGLGVIENDFHDRKDLSPNVCAVFTEPLYRSKGIAGALLDFAARDMASFGVHTLYLVTEHDSFYERYGWRFFTTVQGEGEDHLSRLYIHEQK